MPTPIRTLADIAPSLLQRFARPALVRRCHAHGIEDWSTQDFVDQVRHVSLGLDALGMKRGDRVALMAESRPEWLIADLGILSGAFVTVPIYPTLAAGQACYILNDSEARVAIVSDRVQLEKLQSIRHLASHLAFIVVIDAGAPATSSAAGAANATSAAAGSGSNADAAGASGSSTSSSSGSVLTLAELVARGRGVEEREPGALARHAERAASIQPADLATIIYTSGTTGEPKGVMLTHHNVVSNVLASHAMLEKGPQDVAFSFLPLSHAFERTVSYCYLDDGVVVTFAESIDTVPRDLPRVQPTLMTGVPRVFEKLHARIMEAASNSPAPRRWIFTWALGVGLLRVQREQNNGGRAVDANWQDRLADKLVFSKIRERVGGRLRVIVSGSAPLPVHVAEFFGAVGLPIMEGYGLTETSPVLSVNPRDAIRNGTVGVALPGVELRIADDGEILARGPNLMKGYWKKPEATAEVIDGDGWFHTGDIGQLTDGYVSITDRKKDLIVTSGGKKLAPQPIEIRLKQNPLVAEAIVIGDRRRYPAVVFVPDFKVLEKRLAALGRPLASREDLVSRADVLGLYQEVVDALNRDLAQYEQLKRIALIPAEFSVMGGELTPSLKVRRAVVEQRWGAVIEKIYDGG
jgi:long-chain acyl-CoA synthetase